MESTPDKLVPAVIGGGIIGMVSAVPGLNFINCFCCAGIILGGFFAVFFYQKNLGEKELIYSDGAFLGILAGVFGLIIYAIMKLIFGFGYEQAIDETFNLINELPPETESILTFFRENNEQLFLLDIAFRLILNLVFGLLGGILGVAILGKKK